MLKHLMIFDLNLSELPTLKEYDGFLPELLGIDDNTKIKELTEVLKIFSKTSVSWIFADFAFFSLRNYIKRCRLGFCNIWKDGDYLKNTIYHSDIWYEEYIAVFLPAFGSLMISFFSTMNYLPNLFSPKELDSLQYFSIGASCLA
jgi:hypothetical protein